MYEVRSRYDPLWKSSNGVDRQSMENRSHRLIEMTFRGSQNTVFQ